MATKIETLLVSLEARINQYEKTMQRSLGVANRTAGGIEARFNRMSKNVNASFQNMLRNGAAFAGGALGVREVAQYADAWTEAGNKLRAAGTAAGVQTRSLDELRASANAARTSLGDYVDLYAKLIRSASGVAKSEQEIANATDIVSKAFKAGGASAAEQASGILQLGQALGSGVLQGDELRSLRENAPVIAKAIADEFGVTVAGLKKLGAEGKITSERVFQAILKAQSNVEAQFKATNGTIADSFTILRNNLTSYIGTMAQATGVTATVQTILGGLANNIGAVANAAAAAGVVLAATFGRGAALATVGALANPFVLLAAAIGAAAFALTNFSSQLEPVKQQLLLAGDYIGGIWDTIDDKVVAAGQVIRDVFVAVADVIGTMIGGAVDVASAAFGGLADFAVTVADTISNAFNAVYNVLVTTFSELPAAIADAVVSAMNFMVGTVESAINAVIGAVNKAIGALNFLTSAGSSGIGAIAPVTLSKLENSYAGAGKKAGASYAAALRAESTNAVSEALGAVQRNAATRTADRRAAELDTQKGGGSYPLALPSGGFGGMIGAAPASGGGGGGRKKKGGGGGQNELQREIEQIKERTSALQAETAAQATVNPLVDDYGYAKTKAAAAADLLNAAEKAGIALTPELRANIDKLAEGYAQASAAAEKLAESQEKAKQTAQEMRDLGKDVLGGFIRDLRDGKSASEALANALNKVADKLLDIALNSIFDGGGGGGGLGGIFGAIGSLFGFSKGTANTGGKRGEPRGIVHGQEAVIPLGAGGKIPIQMPPPVTPRGSGGTNETITVMLQDDSGRMADIADAQIKTHAGTIVKVATQQSMQQVKGAFPGLMNDAQTRKM